GQAGRPHGGGRNDPARPDQQPPGNARALFGAARAHRAGNLAQSDVSGAKSRAGMTRMRVIELRALAVAILACVGAVHAAEPDAPGMVWSGALRTQLEPVAGNPAGPLAAASALSPGLAPRPRSSGGLDAELR